MRNTLWSITLVIFNALSVYSQSSTGGTTVQTQQGSVTGSIITPGVRQFLGIPYATAKRWQAPQKPAKKSSSTTLDATSFGPSCPQSLTPIDNEFLSLSGSAGQSTSESETCQTVNIWAPSTDRPQNTSVMIWIYGGSFAYGTTDFKYYIGENIVKNNDDVTVVSLNYRTNIFGQPNAPQLVSLTNSQNFGLLDQKAAIQWVFDNIAVFGGDPDRIIIFGESAGAISVDAYSYANPDDTIVKGIIQESGSLAGNSLLVPQAPESTVISWTEVATSVGCTDLADPFQLACMELIPFQELENVVIALEAAFAPVPDGITYFDDINERSAAGNFLKVPLLVGSNADEGDIFVVSLEDLELGGAIPGLTQEGSADVTELLFTCPASITAAGRVDAGVPTYRYRYEGDNHLSLGLFIANYIKAIFPDMTNNNPDLGAYHSSEIPIVFGTYNSSAFSEPATDVEIALSTYVQSAWVAFARDPVNGLTNFGWPLYNPNTASIARLGSTDNQTGVVFGSSATFDVGCDSTEEELSLVEAVFALTSGF